MIIDFHTHIVPPSIKEHRESLIAQDACFRDLYSDPKAKMATAEDLIESMDRDGVDISVVTNIGWTRPELCRQTNDYIMESVAKYAGRFIGFCTVVPQSNEAPAEIERCARGGLKGVGELMPHIQGFDLGKKALMEPIVAAAKAHGMVILTHSSEPVGHIYPGKGNVFPGMLYRFIADFPDIPIVCAHWGGGLPFYALMPEVGEALKNVYFDTAASPFLYKYDIFPRVADLIGPEKILFGSDFPLITQMRIIKRLRDLPMPEESKALILGKNAQHLLGLS